LRSCGKKTFAKAVPTDTGLIGDGWTDGGNVKRWKPAVARGGSRIEVRKKTAPTRRQRKALIAVTNGNNAGEQIVGVDEL